MNKKKNIFPFKKRKENNLYSPNFYINYFKGLMFVNNIRKKYLKLTKIWYIKYIDIQYIVSETNDHKANYVKIYIYIINNAFATMKKMNISVFRIEFIYIYFFL